MFSIELTNAQANKIVDWMGENNMQCPKDPLVQTSEEAKQIANQAQKEMTLKEDSSLTKEKMLHEQAAKIDGIFKEIEQINIKLTTEKDKSKREELESNRDNFKLEIKNIEDQRRDEFNFIMGQVEAEDDSFEITEAQIDKFLDDYMHMLKIRFVIKKDPNI